MLMKYSAGSVLVRGRDEPRKRGAISNLFAFSLNPLEYGFECTICEPTLLAGFLVFFVSGAQPLGAKVEGVTEWFVNTCESVLSSHEDLQKYR